MNALYCLLCMLMIAAMEALILVAAVVTIQIDTIFGVKTMDQDYVAVGLIMAFALTIGIGVAPCRWPGDV